MTAGLILLGFGFSTTLLLVARALGPDELSALVPIAVGVPPILLGYLACHFASHRLMRARALEGGDR